MIDWFLMWMALVFTAIILFTRRKHWRFNVTLGVFLIITIYLYYFWSPQ